MTSDRRSRRALLVALATLVCACRSEKPAPVETPRGAERELSLLEHARAIGEKMRDRRFHAELLAELADAHAVRSASVAKELLVEANTTLVRVSPPDEKGLAATRIAASVATVGAFEEALELAKTIQSPEQRVLAQSRVAVIAAERGQHARAAGIAETLATEDARNEAFAAAAKTAAAAGDFPAAEKYAAKCTRPERKGEALAAIVRAMVVKGALTASQKVAEQIESGHWKSEAFAEIALEQYDKGQTTKADRTARAIESSWIQARLYADLARRASRAGNGRRANEMFEKAVSTAEGIHDDVMMAAAMEDLVDRALVMGRVKDAFGFVDKCASKEARSRALAKIAVAMARGGNTAEAEATAKRIGGDAIASADAYGAIALAKAKRGDDGAAMEALAGISTLQLRLAPVAKVIAESTAAKRKVESIALANLKTLLEAN